MNKKYPSFLSAVSRPVCLVALLFGAALPSEATVIVSDDFNYSNGTPLNGLNGGTGWSSSWTVSAGSASTTIQNSQLQVGNGAAISNGDNLIFRSFSAYNGDTLYATVTLDAAAGFETGDFFMMWLDTAATGNHANVPNMGFDSAGNVVGRLSSSRSVNGGAVTQGTSYNLVISLSKSTPGASSNYDTLSVWKDPAFGDLGTPLGTVTLDIGRSSISTIGFRSVNNEAGNIYLVDNLILGTTWADVVPVPEPSTLAFAFLGTAFLLGGRRAKKRFDWPGAVSIWKS